MHKITIAIIQECILASGPHQKRLQALSYILGHLHHWSRVDSVDVDCLWNYVRMSTPRVQASAASRANTNMSNTLSVRDDSSSRRTHCGGGNRFAGQQQQARLTCHPDHQRVVVWILPTLEVKVEHLCCLQKSFACLIIYGAAEGAQRHR